MQKPLTIQLSRFKTPRVAKGPRGIDYSTSPYLIFAKQLYSRFNKVFFWVFISLFLFAVFPRPSHTVLLDPIIPGRGVVLASELKVPSYAPVEPLERILHDLKPYGTYPNTYVGGQCTDGVASRLGVPGGWGNANQWPVSAQAAGYEVSSVPKVGAIAVSYTDSWLGHVAIVTSVAPLTIWEMNFAGPYSTDERSANSGEFSVYIYF